MALTIKKNDVVVVISGRDKGKKGRVLSVNRKKGTILVENCNFVKRHTRPIPQKNIKGGILEKEAPLPFCKVKLFCSDCQNPTSIKSQIGDNGKKMRVCKKCGAALVKGA